MSSVEGIQACIAPLRAVPKAFRLNSRIRTQAHLRVASLSTGVEIVDLALSAFDIPRTFAHWHRSVQPDGGNFALAL